MADNPFGRVITAMVTPMHDDGAIDYDGLQHLAVHLADRGHDGLLVNGTTGESATTTDDEDYACVAAVVEAVGDRVAVMAGCGTNDTEHSMRAAEEMADRGADSLLVVTPYYNKPTQDGIVEHFRMIAEAGDLPVMAYDIPGRTGTALATDTIRRLSEIPGVRAVKDAKGDLFESSRLMAETDLLWYSGDDVLNLAHGSLYLLGTYFGYTLVELHHVAFIPAALLSILLHGLTVTPVMRWLDREHGRDPDAEEESAASLA